MVCRAAAYARLLRYGGLNLIAVAPSAGLVEGEMATISHGEKVMPRTR
jgi:hypothetical protein